MSRKPLCGAAEFIKAWNGSNTIEECAKTLSLTEKQCKSKAMTLRVRNNVSLKKFKRGRKVGTKVTEPEKELVTA